MDELIGSQLSGEAAGTSDTNRTSFRTGGGGDPTSGLRKGDDGLTAAIGHKLGSTAGHGQSRQPTGMDGDRGAWTVKGTRWHVGSQAPIFLLGRTKEG